MTEGPEDTGAQNTPPSFIPSGNRRRSPRSSAQQPPASAHHGAHAAGGQPPSFAPKARQRSSASPASGRTDPAPSAAGAPSGAPSAPQSFQPVLRPARRSSGSSRNASAGAARPAVSAAQSPSRPAMSPSAASGPATGLPSGAGAAALHRRRGIRPLRVVAIVLAALLLALALGLFGAWNWVDGRLTKQPWLTGAADTPASTWLILGSDERADGQGDDEITGSRTDTILVLTKPRSGNSSLISIPRDSLVTVDDMSMKINAVAELYDNQTLVATVESITGQKIDHVAQIKFDGLKNVVDALGGIELCYDSDVSDPYSGLEWQAGCHVADGTTALAFSRMRYADALGDFGRGERQRQVIGAIMRKGLSAGTLTDIGTVTNVAETTLDAVTVDEDTNPYTLIRMALAFRDATGDDGISGSVYWTNPDYYVDGVGSSVLLDDERNLTLFTALADGTQPAGTVGTLAEG